MISTQYSSPVSTGVVTQGGASGSAGGITPALEEILKELEALLMQTLGGSQGQPAPTGQQVPMQGGQGAPGQFFAAGGFPAGSAQLPQLPQASLLPTTIGIPMMPLAQPATSGAMASPLAAPQAPAAPAAPPAASQKPCAASPDPTMAQFGTTMPNDQTKRPPGDNRTAQQIIDDNPLLKNLGNQSGVKDNLNKFVGGDMANNPDQAYKAAALLTYIKSSANSKGDTRDTSQVGNGKIDGFTKDGDARHGTEAGLLQDVVGGGGHPGGGWDHLQGTKHDLDVTSDTHVNADGTNKDNLQWGMEQAGKYVGAFFKGLGKSVIDIFTKGRINPVSAILTVVKDVGVSEAKTAIENSSLGDAAKQTAGKVFGVLDNI